MKNKYFWFATGVSIGAVSLVLVNQYRKTRTRVVAWQKQQQPALDVLGCPVCHSSLTSVSLPQGKGLYCASCLVDYPVVDGITHFIQSEELSGLNKRFSKMYDWFSWGYRAFSKIAFAYIGMTEEQARREVTNRLDPKGGQVLEVSIGPGVNLPYLIGRPDVGAIHGLDISHGQLNRCRAYVANKGWNVNLNLGNAEQLPYQDNSFDGVFHLGGINFFNDKKKAIEEMIRVAKPGTRILICDENEKGAQAYERIIPGFKRNVGSKRDVVVAPVTLVPPEMLELREFEVWNGWMYCIEFRKP
jgi:ubiquinone/menaquinone biosynthesis C-methylase UbiE/uncharacterized protein YbaR (Trm112 family)